MFSFPNAKLYYGIFVERCVCLIYVSIAKDIPSERTWKKLIIILNRVGLSSSYDEFQRIDYILANSVLERLGKYSVPVLNSANSSLI